MKRLDDCMYRENCTYEKNECDFSCKRYKRTRFLLDVSNIPESLRTVNLLEASTVDVDAFTTLAAIKNNIDDFVSNGRILYLWSNTCGNGKTTWSIKMGLEYINQVWKYHYERPVVVFISVPDFLYKSKCFNSNMEDTARKIRQYAEKADLVIFDDIGLDYISKYDYASIFSLIDTLSMNNKSMIFTSNYDPKKLSQFVGERLPSRICNDYIVELKGEDKRKARRINELLGGK